MSRVLTLVTFPTDPGMEKLIRFPDVIPPQGIFVQDLEGKQALEAYFRPSDIISPVLGCMSLSSTWPGEGMIEYVLDEHEAWSEQVRQYFYEEFAPNGILHRVISSSSPDFFAWMEANNLDLNYLVNTSKLQFQWDLRLPNIIYGIWATLNFPEAFHASNVVQISLAGGGFHLAEDWIANIRKEAESELVIE